MNPARNFVSVALILLLPGVALPAAASGARTYEVSLTRGSRLLVQAQVNGHPVEALLDSAAESTLIDRQFARTLKLASDDTVSGQGSGGSSFEASLVKGVRLQVFGVSLENQTIAVTDLKDVGQRLLGRRIDVILGREIFDAARLEIDVEGRRITVLPGGSNPAGSRLELTTEHGVETIPVSVEQAGPVRATFDLGNGSQVLIGKQLVERLHLLSDGHVVSASRGGGLGGETERQVIVLHSLEVAGRRFENVPAAIDPQPSASDLNVGVDILRHFVITTDFAAHAVWLQPRPDAPTP
jgi:predicted aspartyl protease